MIRLPFCSKAPYFLLSFLCFVSIGCQTTPNNNQSTQGPSPQPPQKETVHENITFQYNDVQNTDKKTQQSTTWDIHVIEFSDNEFPLMALTFNVQVPKNISSFTLRKDHIEFDHEPKTYSFPFEPMKERKMLTQYFENAPINETGIVSLQTSDSHNPSIYRLTWFDTSWVDHTNERTYHINIHLPEKTFNQSFKVTPSEETLKQLQEKEFTAAIECIEEEGQSDKVIRTLRTRYPQEKLEPFYVGFHNTIVSPILQNNPKKALEHLQSIESIYSDKTQWQSRFKNDYETVGNSYFQKDQFKNAISYYRKALNYEEDTSIRQKILDCQLREFRFKDAQQTAGKLPDESHLLFKKAIAFEGSLNFLQAESFIKKLFKNHPPEKTHWSHLALLWKGVWYGGTAQILAYLLPDLNQPNEFMEITKHLALNEDYRWVGWINRDKQIQYASDLSIQGVTVATIHPSLTHLNFAELNNPVFTQWSEENLHKGLVLVPSQFNDESVVLALCFDSRLVGLSEKKSFQSIQQFPNNDKLWIQFKNEITNRCGGAMTKTIGAVLKKKDLSHQTWIESAKHISAFLPQNLVSYTILAGRKSPDGPIQIIHVEPKDVPDSIVNLNRANSNPFFLYENRTWDEKELIEMVTAIYAGDKWLGVHRAGYSWE